MSVTDGPEDDDATPLHPALRRVAAPPMGALLGFELVEVSGGRAVMQVAPRAEHENGGGVTHGGLTASLIDSATGCAILSAVAADAVIATVDLNITYARPIPIDGGTLTATATVDHLGRTVAVASCEVRDPKGRVVTLGRATYAVRTR
ncbi:MAG: PaaI family thioesterase [Actinobacteria bacterium]|nr:PaaI family thioesterase [Actinomycetota bacterium]